MNKIQQCFFKLTFSVFSNKLICFIFNDKLIKIYIQANWQFGLFIECQSFGLFKISILFILMQIYFLADHVSHLFLTILYFFVCIDNIYFFTFDIVQIEIFLSHIWKYWIHFKKILRTCERLNQMLCYLQQHLSQINKYNDCQIKIQDKLYIKSMLKKIFAYTFLALIAFGVIHYFTLPDPLSKLQVPHKFQIYRDQDGIPRIVAKDYESLFFAIGFAQGQDRLWGLNLKRMIVQGRVSEIFGSQVLPLDLQMRNYAFKEVGKMNSKQISAQTKRYLQLYADGINQYAKIQNYLPIEFYLTWTPWQKWTVQTSLSTLALTSFVLQFDWMYQIARQRLLETVGFDLAWKMMPFGQNNLFRETTIMSNQELKQMGRYKYYNSSKIEEILKEHWVKKTMPIGSINMPYTDYQTLGSNAWVISGEHTQTGRPLLANDPHVGLLIPSFFYMVELIVLQKESSDIKHQVFGVMVDGLPAISIGVNGKFAWGSTASYVDNKDVFHEKVRNNNGTLQYFFKEQWKQFKIRKQVFKVRGSEDILKQFYHTHRGPVIEDIFYDLHFKYGYPIPSKYRENHTLSLASAIYFPDSSSAEGLINLAFSDNLQKFKDMSSKINCPNIDSVFIEKDGIWGYSPVGRIPKRNIPQMGAFVKDGTTDIYDMKQFINYEHFPRLYNPKKGYACMANNKYAEDGLDDRSSIHELTTGRAYRLQKFITNKINKNQKFNFDTMKEMQLDNRDQFLSEAFPFILKKLQETRSLWSDPKTQELFQRLKKWDYHMPIKSIEASIYHVFEHQFHETLLHKTSLSSQQRQSILNHAFFEVYIFKLYEKIGKNDLTDQQRIVCQNQYTNNYTDIHPCVVNAALSFKKLPAKLQQIFRSSNIQDYQWGVIHKHVFKSIPFSEIPILKNIWGREIPAAGNSRTLNVAILSHQTKSFKSIAGPVFRFVTDLNKTIFSFDLGETDRLLSPYYDNFLGQDRYVEYTPRNPLKQNITEWKLTLTNLL